jgi:hypothetical protein
LTPKSERIGGVNAPFVSHTIRNEPLFENPLTDREGALAENPAQPLGAEGLSFKALQDLFYAVHNE